MSSFVRVSSENKFSFKLTLRMLLCIVWHNMFIFCSLSAIFHIFPMHFYSFFMKTIFKIHFLDSVSLTPALIDRNFSIAGSTALINWKLFRTPILRSTFSTPSLTDRDSTYKHPKSESGSIFTLSSTSLRFLSHFSWQLPPQTNKNQFSNQNSSRFCRLVHGKSF